MYSKPIFETRELRKSGSKVRLQEQPFQVLALLIERRGEIVSRDELRNRLWTADTFVDFDHGLNKAINKIRETLGDSAASPRFVETIARRGYRFIADVSWSRQTTRNTSHADRTGPGRAPDARARQRSGGSATSAVRTRVVAVAVVLAALRRSRCWPLLAAPKPLIVGNPIGGGAAAGKPVG